MQTIRDYLFSFLSKRCKNYDYQENTSGIKDLNALKAILDASKEKFQFKSCMFFQLDSTNRMQLVIDVNESLQLRIYKSVVIERDFAPYYMEIIFNNYTRVCITTYDPYNSIEAIYKDEDLRNISIENLRVEYNKKMKMKDMAEKSIEGLLSSELQDFNHSWNLLNDGDSSSLLEIKISNKRFLKIRIKHNNFIEKIPLIKKFVLDMEQLEKYTGLNMVIEHYGNNKEWKNG